MYNTTKMQIKIKNQRKYKPLCTLVVVCTHGGFLYINHTTNEKRKKRFLQDYL